MARFRYKSFKHSRNNLGLTIICLVILFVGIGYAYLTSNLSISGTTGIVGNSWDIHFENLNVKDGSVTATNPATIQSNKVDITYSIRLERPKDYYEFTVDVKNDGTLPGKVSISSLAGITTEAASIIDYTITYINGRSVNIGDILNAGAKKTIRVRVFYKDEINPDDFPATDLNLTLTYTLQYVQSEVDEFDTNALIEQLKTENLYCFTKYEGQATDQVGVTKSAENVYFNRCEDERNIIFNNMCWQMIRTTETGGIKMIYNGDPVDGKCESTRGNHKGIVQSNYTTQTLNSSYLYGESFTYDISTNEFTLTNTTTSTWSDSTYEDLIGKFTCKNTTGICTTMYQINGYSSNTRGYSSTYTIGNTKYSQIGTSAFNANSNSPAMVGYMFNKVYSYNWRTISTSTKFGSTFTYENGTYTLSGTTQDLTTLSGSDIANTHYTCWNDTGTCSNISYVYYISSSTGSYIEISDGKDITDAINEMLYNDNVNRYNSSIKGIIDGWYVQNLSSKTSMLEDIVYCNARNMSNQSTNGWNPDGGSTSTYMYFKNYSSNKDLSCVNETDQFAVSNNKAKLTYPVSLINNEEWDNIGIISLRQTGVNYWDLSPGYFGDDAANAGYVSFTGGLGGSFYVFNGAGLRPAVSLNSGAVIAEGDGSEGKPWIIEE